MPRRVLQGTVVSDKSEKTVVISVVRKYKHPIFKKFVTSKKKYAAHDPENQYKTGDVVSIIEHKPISKNKRWHVVNNKIEGK